MDFKDTFFSKKRTLNIRGSLLDLSRPAVMGVLNITPDSFYDGGRYQENDNILRRVEELLAEGATFIDIGAYSSRPGARHLTEKEEYSRLKPRVAQIRKKFPETKASFKNRKIKLKRILATEWSKHSGVDIFA